MKQTNLSITKSFEEFLQICDLNDAEMLNMCDTVFNNADFAPFRLVPAAHSEENVILVYTPNNTGLILTPDAKNYIIKWIENNKFKGVPYDVYLSWKMAVEKDD